MTQQPEAAGPPWWCATCDSWRHTQPCGRDECPKPNTPPLPASLDTEGIRHEAEPPARHVARAVEMSACSPCRSKRGVSIYRGETPIASGYNFKPRGFDCDGSDACKATCRAEAIHAEQFALLRAGRLAEGADMLHVKTVDGELVPSGGPSCVQCSKLALASGIAGVWLFHEHGWYRYEAAEFHTKSLQNAELDSRVNGAKSSVSEAEGWREKEDAKDAVRCQDCGASSPSTTCDVTGFACRTVPLPPRPEQAK